MAETKEIVKDGAESTVPENETPVQEPQKEVSVFDMMDKYFELTGLKLDKNCHMDREFASLWYQSKYLTGVQTKWAMVSGARIYHYVDGVVYKTSNMTDEIAERLMKENPSYIDLFIDLSKKK